MISPPLTGVSNLQRAAVMSTPAPDIRETPSISAAWQMHIKNSMLILIVGRACMLYTSPTYSTLLWYSIGPLTRNTILDWGSKHYPGRQRTNEVYATNELNFLGPISYGTQQVEPQLLMAYILTSGPVLNLHTRHFKIRDRRVLSNVHLNHKWLTRGVMSIFFIVQEWLEWRLPCFLM
jgi:hypothetical protein